MFTWVLQRLADAGLLKGKTVGIDATPLEANAALRSIVRRDTGEGYEAFLRGLASSSDIPTPTRAELARLDRKRPTKGSNDDWTHPQDPDAKITKMKDGRTHLAHKAEHAVDLETGAVVGVTVQGCQRGGAGRSRAAGRWRRGRGGRRQRGITATRRWSRWPTWGCAATCRSRTAGGVAGEANSPTAMSYMPTGAGSGGSGGCGLLRQCGERLERPHAHLYETGRLRRVRTPTS